MKTSTALSAAMARAGYNPAADRLYVEATNALGANASSPWAAVDQFQHAIEGNADLLAALLKWDPAAFESLALEYLRSVAGDMSGGGAVAAGRTSSDTRSGIAGGHIHSGGAKPSSDVRAGAGRTASDAHRQAARPGANTPIPAKAPRGASAIASVQYVMKSALDTFLVRDGRGIGDVRIVEIPLLTEQNDREAYVLTEIKKRVDTFATNVDTEWRVRDFIKPADFKAIVDSYSNTGKPGKGGGRGKTS